MDDTKLAKTSQELLESTAVKRKKVSKIACLKDFRRMYVEGGGGQDGGPNSRAIWAPTQLQRIPTELQESKTM